MELDLGSLSLDEVGGRSVLGAASSGSTRTGGRDLPTTPAGAAPTYSAERRFDQVYSRHELLGKGAFSTVHRCVRHDTGEACAVKVIDLRPLRLRQHFDAQRLLREVTIMRRLDHPNIVKLYDVFEEPDSLLLVMELVPGVELFDSILSKSRYTEDEARPVFIQIASALKYLHDQNIVHRDIKPENIVLVEYSEGERKNGCTVKLLDFGLSKSLDSEFGSAAKTFVGTPCYLAPEVESLKTTNGTSGQTYGLAVDVWSLGAVLFVTLAAQFPAFDRATGVPLVLLDGKAWEGATPVVKDLIRNLMHPDPAQRLTMDQALSHPWTVGQASSLAGKGAPSDGALVLSTTTTTTTELPVPNWGLEVPENTTTPAPRPAQAMAPGGWLAGLSALDPNMHAVVAGASPPRAGDAGAVAASPALDLGNAQPGASPSRTQAVTLWRPAADKLANPNGSASGACLLVQLHHKVCKLFRAALASYPQPTTAAKIRQCALMGRTQMMDTLQFLAKLEAMSRQVQESLQEVALAVQADEPRFAHQVLEMQRRWLVDLREEAMAVKRSNQMLVAALNTLILELGVLQVPQTPPLPAGTKPAAPEIQLEVDEGLLQRMQDLAAPYKPLSEEEFLSLMLPKVATSPPTSPAARDDPAKPCATNPSAAAAAAADPNSSPLLQLPLILDKIDAQLESSTILWANIEVVFDVMLKKGDHIDQFVDFGKNPRLMERFQARMSDYQYFWNYIQVMATANVAAPEIVQMYSFVEKPLEGTGTDLAAAATSLEPRLRLMMDA